MNLAEGQRRLSQTLAINQDTGSDTSDKGARIEIPVGTHDYVSLFYVLRTFNLTLKKRSAISVLVENQPKTLFVESQEKQKKIKKIKKKKKKKQTIELENIIFFFFFFSFTTDDPQPDKYQLRIWI